MKYNYQARTKTGEIQSGVVESTSRDSALSFLRSHNLFVTILEEVSPPFYAKRLKLLNRVPKKEIVVFSRQLAIMFKSEIPLVEVFNTLAKQIKNPTMKEKIFDMVEKIEGGTSLSKTFAFYPEIFSPFYINMVRSGEVSGKLSEVFYYLADYLEKSYDFESKIKGAMIYPIFLSLVFSIVLGIIIFFLIPQMTQVLSETGGELPAMTQLLMGFSLFLRKWGWLLLLLFLGLLVSVYFYLKTKEGKAFFDRNLLKFPLLGTFLKDIYLSRVALNLSTLISGGIPIAQALEVTSHAVGNDVYRGIILAAAEGVKRGEPISQVLERHPQEFTPLVVQMLVVGEKTGKLELSLKNIIDFYQKEVDRELNDFMRLLEPILIVVFGVLVGGLMAAVIIPIYQVVGGGF